jgi:HPt (histidine-containing phosphotransfer) domain-containing protein
MSASVIATRLAELWRNSRPLILERMTLLQSALASLTRNPADAEARTAGREAAHKLSGILGIFGLPEGSRIASEIEGILIIPNDGGPDVLTPAALAGLRSFIAELEAVIASKE